MALHPHEFIRRWLLHVLPKGLTRIRHYGYLSPAARKTRCESAPCSVSSANRCPSFPNLKPFTCQYCGGVLTFLRDIAPVRLLRGPPRPISVPA